LKARNGFVSNSSSASFVIPLCNINVLQQYSILNYDFVVKAMYESLLVDDEWMEYVYGYGGWTVKETPNSIEGWTDMDNFDFRVFLDMLGLVEGKDYDYDRSC
jgi:hypothetical protein